MPFKFLPYCRLSPSLTYYSVPCKAASSARHMSGLTYKDPLNQRVVKYIQDMWSSSQDKKLQVAKGSTSSNFTSRFTFCCLLYFQPLILFNSRAKIEIKLVNKMKKPTTLSLDTVKEMFRLALLFQTPLRTSFTCQDFTPP